MEFLDGVALTDLQAVSAITNARPDEVLVNALNTWFLSLTMCPTFHADVHAGNFYKIFTPFSPPPPPLIFLLRYGFTTM